MTDSSRTPTLPVLRVRWWLRGLISSVPASGLSGRAFEMWPKAQTRCAAHRGSIVVFSCYAVGQASEAGDGASAVFYRAPEVAVR